MIQFLLCVWCVHVGSCIVYECLYTSLKVFVGMSVGMCIHVSVHACRHQKLMLVVILHSLPLYVLRYSLLFDPKLTNLAGLTS